MNQVKKCFIISPIGKENSDQRKHADQVFKYIIKPALEECKIEPIRSDHMHDTGKITEQVFNAIQEFDMCIAVLAFDNPNVYYELAVAQCAARPVIILIEKGKEIPFDLKDERVIYYDLTIPSYVERTHINSVIEFIRNFEEINWKVPCSIPGFDDTMKTRDFQYFETAQKFGGDEVWKEIINDSEKMLYLMGTALNAWRYTYTDRIGESFGEILLKKAEEGCKIKILIMNPDNDALCQIHNQHIIPVLPEEVSNTVRVNVEFYSKYADKSDNIELRQINAGRLTQNQAINDKYGIFIPHFYSIKSSNFPLWKFNEGSNLYNQLLKEFKGLWQLNAPIKEEKEKAKISSMRKLSIYMSYPTEDADLFKINNIARELKTYDQIDQIFYYEGDSHKSFIQYLNENLRKSDVLLLFCSSNTSKSKFIDKEWVGADANNIPIIPVFLEHDFIPPLLKSRLGVQYNTPNPQKFIENIYTLILKKTLNLEFTKLVGKKEN
ncbi:MAG: toll/interleukin-1 receptor domain-containing protein [Candidatus Thorarchaeota archaeon]